MVSARDSFVTAIIVFTASFMAAPAPDGPSSMWPFVMASRTGLARSYASPSPPTIAKSCAVSATETLPDTGASRTSTPRGSASRTRRATTAGPIVLISSTTEPGRKRSSRPLSTRTASAAAPSVSIVTTTAAAASSAGSATATAPSSTRGVHRAAVRFQTRSRNLARSTLRAMGRPMRPRPANPTIIGSDKDLSAVHHVHLPGHVIGLGRGEVDEERRELLGRGGASDEGAGGELSHRIGVRRLRMDRAEILVEPDPHWGVDDAGRERVDGDPVLDQTAGGGLRHRERAELGDAVRDEIPEALATRDRASVDDLAAGALRDHLLGCL